MVQRHSGLTDVYIVVSATVHATPVWCVVLQWKWQTY
jgi:hypothetical protein